MNDNRNTYNNEDFVYMCKLLQKYEITLDTISPDDILLVNGNESGQSVEVISTILNTHEINDDNKDYRWVCYNDMVVFYSGWKYFKEEFVFGSPVKAIIFYCENIGKETEKKPFRHSDLHPESETLKQLLELSEKMTKVGLTLTPEQENTLLHNVIDELSAEITRLKLKIEELS